MRIRRKEARFNEMDKVQFEPPSLCQLDSTRLDWLGRASADRWAMRAGQFTVSWPLLDFACFQRITFGSPS